MPERVLIAGVSSHWGAELARRLERDPKIKRIIGLDVKPLPEDLERTEFVDLDIRSPDIVRFIPGTGVDTAVHCGIVWYPEAGKPARALHDINVIGTLQLLSACERTPSLRSLVVRGSAAIYGSVGPAPGFYTEDMARRYPLKTRFQRDIGELESYVENFARRRPDVTACILRYQPEIGPDLDSPLVRYLKLPVVPTQMGFDPRLQFIHEDDATRALDASVRSPVPGPVNVAPNGSVSLSKILRMARRPALPVPHPLYGTLFSRLGRRLGSADLWGDGVLLLRYGRGVDNTRLRREVGYEPAFDAVGAARDFALRASSRAALPAPSTLARRALGT